MLYARGVNDFVQVNANPNPMEKSTMITVSVECDIRVDVVIENLNGEVIKNIYSGELRAGNHEFLWTRLDNVGQIVPEGSYNISVNFNTRYTSTKKTLILK
jgi:flagellar hook assembly protein FlgD